MKVVTPEQMAEIDRRTEEEYAIPGRILMENAGLKGFLRFLELAFGDGEGGEIGARYRPESYSYLFVAGSGNNGGDALVMARQAHLFGFPLFFKSWPCKPPSVGV